MAKITNPLHSFAASGTIGGLVTFRETRGRAIALARPAPTGAPSAAQALRRQTYRDTCAAWNALTPEQRAAWTATGALRRITGFNAYLSANLGAVAPVLPQGFTIIPLMQGGTYNNANAVSADGSIVMGDGDYNGVPVAYTWTLAGGVVPMALPPNAVGATAVGISADGNARCGNMDTNTMSQAWHWSAADGYTVIDPLLGGDFVQCTHISADGLTVVGHSMTQGVAEPFAWTKAGGIVDLGLPLNASQAWCACCDGTGDKFAGMALFAGQLIATKKQGQQDWEQIPMVPGAMGAYAVAMAETAPDIVGQTDDGAGGRAWHWKQGTGTVELPLLPNGGYTITTGESGDGTVQIGYALNVDSLERAVRWINEVISEIGILPNGTYSAATSCNTGGNIVTGYADTNGVEVAFVWKA